MGKIAGVDGCRGGWIVAMAGDWPPISGIEMLLCRSFQEVLENTAGCCAVAVDMPIGLPEGRSNTQWPRICDRMARTLLGPQGTSRVFLAPPRETLHAMDPRGFQNLHLEATGVKASLPVWGILPKIREVDSYMSPELQERVFEFYPELVWMDMINSEHENQNACGATRTGSAGRVIHCRLFPSKHSERGIEARIDLLQKAGLRINVEQLTSWKNRLTDRVRLSCISLKLDDLLDALSGIRAGKDFLAYRLHLMEKEDVIKERIQVVDEERGKEDTRRGIDLYTAQGFHCSFSIPRLPATELPTDAKGLRMEIWY